MELATHLHLALMLRISRTNTSTLPYALNCMHRCRFTITHFPYLMYFHQTAMRFYDNCASQELLWQMWSEVHTTVINGLYNLHTPKINSGKGKTFCSPKHPQQHWGPSRPLFSEYQGTFLGPKQPACKVNHSTLLNTRYPTVLSALIT